MRIPIAVLVGILGLAGCTVGPDYIEPTDAVSSDWLTPEGAQGLVDPDAAVVVRWWEIFDDPILSALIDDAVRANHDIRIATANVREARVLRGAVRGRYIPSFDARAGATTGRISENGRQAGFPAAGSDQDVFDAAFDMRWEIDIFGGTRREVEAAVARVERLQEVERDILLTVLSDVARTYMELRGAQRRFDLARRNVALQQQTLDLVSRRHDVGAASTFELRRTESSLRSTEALLPNLEADIRIPAYQLAVLTAREPQALLDTLLETEPLPLTPDIVPIGLRSGILTRRPDVRGAERLLAAQTADVGARTADLFPRFVLTGAAGLESLEADTLIGADSGFWSLGPRLEWPIFAAGQIRNAVRAEEAQVEAALAAYEQTVLLALQDVEIALVRYGHELETRQRFRAAVEVNAEAVELARIRYEQGQDDLLALIDAQRELTDLQDQFAQVQTRALVNLVSLYKALGGGWEHTFDTGEETSL